MYMNMKEILIDLINQDLTAALMIIAIVAVSFILAIFVMAHKLSKSFFESFTMSKLQEIERNMLSRFTGYENKFMKALDDVKMQSDFKQSKILLLNDKNGHIGRILNLADFKNVTGDISDGISTFLLYLSEEFEQELQILAETLAKLPENGHLIVYTNHSVNRNLLPVNVVMTNFEFTLIEKLHTAYLVNKLMEK